MNSITDAIAELRALSVPELVARYETAFGKPPRSKHKAYLWKRIAWKLQEQRFGGLSTVAQNRLEELIAEIDIPIEEREREIGRQRRRARDRSPSTATLTREWRGRQIVARPVHGGFECDGVVHKSLSAVAKAVTGSHWNGRLFFGLAARKKVQ